MAICCVCGKKTIFTIPDHDNIYCTKCYQKLGAKGMFNAAINKDSSAEEVHNKITTKAAHTVQANQAEKIIKEKMKATGGGMGILSNGSVKAAAAMILPEEIIISAMDTTASLGEPHRSFSSKPVIKFKGKVAGIVVITDKRLIFAAKSGFNASLTMYLVDINSVTIDNTDLHSLMIPGMSAMKISTSSASVAIYNLKTFLNPLKKALDEAIHNARFPQQSSMSNLGENYSAADEIVKFKQLLDQGIITQEEFDLKKKQLLGL